MKQRKYVNRKIQQITASNLERLSWSRGFDGVPGLADHIGRARVTVWRAVANPQRFGPTYQKLLAALKP
jgi:hypothetical protein